MRNGLVVIEKLKQYEADRFAIVGILVLVSMEREHSAYAHKQLLRRVCPVSLVGTYGKAIAFIFDID